MDQQMMEWIIISGKYGSTDDGMDHHSWMVWINRRWNGSSLDSMDQHMMEWIITG
jgi:hypothetical protein